MYKVKTLNVIAQPGLDQFPKDRYQLGSDEANPCAIILRSFNMHEMDIPASVIVVGRAGAGTNNIPVAELTKKGIPVLNTPGANANAVCEMVMAGLFLASRNICPAWDYVKHLQGSDQDISCQVEKNKKQFAGFEVMGKKLGVIGLGSIGTKVANTAIALGMQVVGYDPAITVSRAWELSSSVEKAQSLDRLLEECDFVTLHVPLIKETTHLLDKAKLRKAKKGIVLLNFARKEIVDYQAVLDALNEEHIGAYITDFPSQALIEHPNVICLPHLGASTAEAEVNCAKAIVQQVQDFLEHGAIRNSVNFPSVEVVNDFSGVRLSIVNQNIPNMVAQISEKLAHVQKNIASMLNKSRGDIAYNLIDIDTDVDQQVLTEIRQIPGVLQVRKLEN